MYSIEIGTVVSEKTSFKMLPDYEKMTFDEGYKMTFTSEIHRC